MLDADTLCRICDWREYDGDPSRITEQDIIEFFEDEEEIYDHEGMVA